jgi:hypothetical protein
MIGGKPPVVKFGNCSWKVSASKNVSPEAQERTPLEAVASQRDWDHYSLRDSDL